MCCLWPVCCCGQWTCPLKLGITSIPCRSMWELTKRVKTLGTREPPEESTMSLQSLSCRWVLLNPHTDKSKSWFVPSLLEIINCIISLLCWCMLDLKFIEIKGFSVGIVCSDLARPSCTWDNIWKRWERQKRNQCLEMTTGHLWTKDLSLGRTARKIHSCTKDWSIFTGSTSIVFTSSIVFWHCVLQPTISWTKCKHNAKKTSKEKVCFPPKAQESNSLAWNLICRHPPNKHLQEIPRPKYMYQSQIPKGIWFADVPTQKANSTEISMTKTEDPFTPLAAEWSWRIANSLVGWLVWMGSRLKKGQILLVSSL